MQNKWFYYGFAAVTALAFACGGDTKTPTSPTPSTSSDSAAAAADGSTLKATAPVLYSPADGAKLSSIPPSLVLNDSTAKFAPPGTPYSYRFQLANAAGAVVDEALEKAGAGVGGANRTVHTVPSTVKFDGEATYKWRARAELSSSSGPWSTYFSFTAPKSLGGDGFQTATTLWDPLTNGRSIGRQTGMEFSTTGARTIGNESSIRYDLLQTISAGEYSFYAYNLNPLSTGDKTKLMSMQEGTDDITTNDYRFTVEKRGASYTVPGQVRIRIIAGDSDEHAGRIFDSAPTVPALVKNTWYFVRLTWGASRARLQIYNADGTTGALGASVLDVNMGYGSYTYKPVPHTAWIGAPVGRAGASDATVSNMTVKWVWIGAAGSPRPGFGQAFEPGE